MSDPVTDLVKAHLKQLRLPAMARELERLSREAAASDRNYTLPRNFMRDR